MEVDDNFPGPWCQENAITKGSLIGHSEVERDIPIKNGLVIELCAFSRNKKLNNQSVSIWLQTLSKKARGTSLKTLDSKVSRVLETEKKFQKKKKNPKFKTKQEYLNAYFYNVGESADITIPGDADSNPVNESTTETIIPAKSENFKKTQSRPVCESGDKSTPSRPLCESDDKSTTSRPQCESDDRSTPSRPVCESDDKSTLSRPQCESDNKSTPSRPLCESGEKSTPSRPLCKSDNKSAPSRSVCESDDKSTPSRPQCESDNYKSTPSRPVCESDSSKLKTSHLLTYEISKQQKQLKTLKNLVREEKLHLNRMKSVSGHFSVRNVTKRDENARSMRKELHLLKQENHRQRLEIKSLRLKIDEIKTQSNRIEEEKNTLVKNLKRLENADNKKTKAQRLASHYRMTVKKIKNENKNADVEKQLKQRLEELESVTIENETLKEKLLGNHHKTKNNDGSFCDNIRLCVIELFGLEIGMEKVPSAIEIVSRHIFSHVFKKSDLPSPSTVRNIVDEGHYLMKNYIASRIQSSNNIGINRDGTSRKKDKILDTTVTLDTGESMSLGFTRVAKETAATINDITKRQFSELAMTTSDGKPDSQTNECDFLISSLDKLSFSMSDRASNEKAADRLLNEWRDEVLKDCNSENQKNSVKQFHCMAHVLLGFHRYVCDDMKKFEKEKDIPIGRDSLPMFKSWSKKQSVIERVVYTSSGIFGPAGDHLGIRDRWEAYCAKHGIKSLIGNYKDNRFNSLFQTGAEVFVHFEDFLKVIQSVNNPNRKLVSVEADLQDETVRTLLEALAVIYLYVTGPYWWLITTNSINYLELYSHVQKLEKYLKKAVETPSSLIVNTWLSHEEFFVPHSSAIQLKLKQRANKEDKTFLNKMLSIMCSAMLRTVQKQLTDFLDGGRYSKAPNDDDVKRTAFAPLTNLACERHFGDLDSSQKRRPNASYHHHSSVQMIKRNRSQLVSWLTDNDPSQLIRRARKEGKLLRKRHREEDLSVTSEISKSMDIETGKKAKKRKVIENPEQEEDYQSSVCVLPIIDGDLNENEYVAVAYQEAWYPGVVLKTVAKDKVNVNFMAPCRKAGTFMWPYRKDIQVVEKQFILERSLIPECSNSGRQWFFSSHKEIDDTYTRYREAFF